MDAVSTVAVLGLRAAPARSEEPVASAAPSPPCRNPPVTEHQMLQSRYIETLRNIQSKAGKKLNNLDILRGFFYKNF